MSNSAFGARCNVDGEEESHGSLSADVLEMGFIFRKTVMRIPFIISNVNQRQGLTGIIAIFGGAAYASLSRSSCSDRRFTDPLTMTETVLLEAMATTSACEMCHIVGVTPGSFPEDARVISRLEVNGWLHRKIKRSPAARSESAGEGRINLSWWDVSTTAWKIFLVATYIDGKKVADGVEFHVWYRYVHTCHGKASSFVKTIEDAGGNVLSSSCAMVMDLRHLNM